MSFDASDALRSAYQQNIAPDLRTIIEAASAAADELNKPAVVVGGAVRDLLMGRPVVDVDIMLESPLDQFIEKLSARLNAQATFHPDFLTYGLKMGLHKIDVVTAREEIYPKPAQLPKVTSSTLEKDFKRRDFTINAMAMRINKSRWGELLDPLNGHVDFQARRLRVLHDQTYRDDPTRIYRAARFASRYALKLEPPMVELIKNAVDQKLPALLSPARRRREFELIFKEPTPLAALKLLSDWGALSFIHDGAELKPEHHTQFSNPPTEAGQRFLWGLTAWFTPWGKAQAEKLMTDLAFERSVKTPILGRLT